MHPAGLRCSSLAYSRYARSSRLAGRAPRRSRLASLFRSGSLARTLDRSNGWLAARQYTVHTGGRARTTRLHLGSGKGSAESPKTRSVIRRGRDGLLRRPGSIGRRSGSFRIRGSLHPAGVESSAAGAGCRARVPGVRGRHSHHLGTKGDASRTHGVRGAGTIMRKSTTSADLDRTHTRLASSGP